jgi:predicted secreted protein
MGKKKLFVVSHCILNTASKVEMDESRLANEYEEKKQFFDLVHSQGIQLLQLPCPEFLLYGSRRWGHVKEQFEHPHFQESCREMLRPILLQLQEYQSNPERFEVLGVISVEGSPSCGYERTCTGDWGGELSISIEQWKEKKDTCHATNQKGVFMRILEEELLKYDIRLAIYSIQKAICKLSERNVV